MKKLLELKDGAVVASGVKRDLPPNQTAIWRDGENVLFYDSAIEKAEGLDALAALAEPATGIGQGYAGEQARAFIGTQSRFYRYSPVAGLVQLRDGLAGPRWSIIPWGEWVIATNNNDPVQVSKNTLSMAALTGVPVAKAKVIRKLGQRPIIFYGQNAAWPSATNIEDWTVGNPTTNAGNFFIRDLDSDVEAVEPLGEGLAYYTQNKMGLVSFIGGNAVFGFKNRLQGIGAISINAVVVVGQKHYGMGQKGVWVTDGSSHRYIDNPDVNRFIDSQRDPDQIDSITSIHVIDKTMVQWFFDCLDGTRRGVGYNYETGAWHLLKMGITAASEMDAFDYPLAALGTAFGYYDKGPNLGTNPLPASITSAPFDAGDDNRYKWWDLVEVHWRGTGTPEIRFGLHTGTVFGDDIDDEWTEWAPLERINHLQRESVFLTMQIRSTALDTTWRVGGLVVWGEPAGLVQ
ncbi:hypothetical protein Kuura_016 [Caulobacter phage Kuura]|nr:hypothetical protein Kuura_016 [Caulobacter phage Kuura]